MVVLDCARPRACSLPPRRDRRRDRARRAGARRGGADAARQVDHRDARRHAARDRRRARRSGLARCDVHVRLPREGAERGRAAVASHRGRDRVRRRRDLRRRPHVVGRARRRRRRRDPPRRRDPGRAHHRVVRSVPRAPCRVQLRGVGRRHAYRLDPHRRRRARARLHVGPGVGGEGAAPARRLERRDAHPARPAALPARRAHVGRQPQPLHPAPAGGSVLDRRAEAGARVVVVDGRAARARSRAGARSSSSRTCRPASI